MPSDPNKEPLKWAAERLSEARGSESPLVPGYFADPLAQALKAIQGKPGVMCAFIYTEEGQGVMVGVADGEAIQAVGTSAFYMRRVKSLIDA